MVCSCIGPQHFHLPVFLPRLLWLVYPVIVRIRNMAEQLLRVGVEKGRRRERRIAAGWGIRMRAGGIGVVYLLLPLVCKQPLAYLAIESLELLLTRRLYGP